MQVLTIIMAQKLVNKIMKEVLLKFVYRAVSHRHYEFDMPCVNFTRETSTHLFWTPKWAINVCTDTNHASLRSKK